MPILPAFAPQFLPQRADQWLEVDGVVAGVFLHLGRERAAAPVGLLGGFFQLHSKVILYQSGEAKLRAADEARGEHRVEDSPRHKVVAALKKAHVVIRAMHEEGVSVERLEKFPQGHSRQRINQHIVAGDAHLNEAELLGICMKAVRLRVNGDPFGRVDLADQGLQMFLGVNHEAAVNRTARRTSSQSGILRGTFFNSCERRELAGWLN